MDESLRQHHLGWLELAQSGNEIAMGVVAYHGITAPPRKPKASSPRSPRAPLADPLDPLGHRGYARNMWPKMVGE
jgi:hypothetical protein